MQVPMYKLKSCHRISIRRTTLTRVFLIIQNHVVLDGISVTEETVMSLNTKDMQLICASSTHY